MAGNTEKEQQDMIGRMNRIFLTKYNGLYTALEGMIVRCNIPQFDGEWTGGPINQEISDDDERCAEVVNCIREFRIKKKLAI